MLSIAARASTMPAVIRIIHRRVQGSPVCHHLVSAAQESAQGCSDARGTACRPPAHQTQARRGSACIGVWTCNTAQWGSMSSQSSSKNSSMGRAGCAATHMRRARGRAARAAGSPCSPQRHVTGGTRCNVHGAAAARGSSKRAHARVRAPKHNIQACSQGACGAVRAWGAARRSTQTLMHACVRACTTGTTGTAPPAAPALLLQNNGK